MTRDTHHWREIFTRKGSHFREMCQFGTISFISILVLVLMERCVITEKVHDTRQLGKRSINFLLCEVLDCLIRNVLTKLPSINHSRNKLPLQYSEMWYFWYWNWYLLLQVSIDFIYEAEQDKFVCYLYLVLLVLDSSFRSTLLPAY